MSVNISHPGLSAELARLSKLHFKTTSPLPAREWMERYVKIPDYSPRPGDYSVDYTPFWRGIFEAYDDPTIRRISIQKGVQISGTQGMQNLKLYSLVNERMPILYVGQTEKDVVKYVSTRLNPMIEECPEVKALLSKKGKNTGVQKDFDTATMFLAWPTVNALASSSIGRAFFDEINKWVHDNKNEAHPYKLAWARLTAFLKIGIKVVETSTPTTETGLITVAFKEGSQDLYNVPCWWCEKEFVQVFSKKTVWWPEEARRQDGSYDLNMIEKESRYVCQNCKKKIEDKYRLPMVEKGVWKQTNPNAPDDHKSYHISGFLSPTITYGKMARDFVESKKSADGLRDFHNNNLGLPFTPKAVTNSAKTIRRLIEKTPVSYRRGELPFKPYAIITAVDVQQKTFWFIKTAYDERGNAWVIDWGELPSFKSIIDEVDKTHEFDGVEYQSRGGFIDSGYRAKKESGVYEFCLKSNDRFFPCKGWADSEARFKTVQEREMEVRGIPLMLYHINDGYFKSELYSRRMKGLAPEMLCLPVDVDNHLSDQLTDERLVNVNGVMKWQPENPSEANNHLGDCLKYNLACWHELDPNMKGDDEEKPSDH